MRPLHFRGEHPSSPVSVSSNLEYHSSQAAKSAIPPLWMATSTDRRRVRFIDDCDGSTHSQSPVTEWHEPSRLVRTQEEWHAIWYDSEELLDVKKRVKRACVRVAEASGPEPVLLTLAHRKTTLILSSDFRGLMKLSNTSPVTDLRTWCSSRLDCRGLERFACRDYNLFRQKDIRDVRRSVLTAQERLRRGDVDVPDDRLLGFESYDETVAAASRLASRRSRAFAHFVGEADALEASRVYSSESIDRGAPPRTISSCCKRAHATVPSTVISAPRSISKDINITTGAASCSEFVRATPARKRSRILIEVNLAQAVANSCSIND
jgi:hypothetical protein